MEAAISEIEGYDLDPATKRQLRLLLVNKPHLLVACVPGDVVQTLQEALQEEQFSTAKLNELERRTRKLEAQQEESRTTKRVDEDIGKEYMEEQKLLSFNQYMLKDATARAEAAAAFTQGFLAAGAERGKPSRQRLQPPTDPTLHNLLQQAFPSVQRIEEVIHLQPRLVAALQAAASALRSPLTLLDTHASGLPNPSGKIDCSCMAAACQVWTQLVLPMEFKLDNEQETSLVGEIVRHCRVILHMQPDRTWGLAVGFSRTCVQFFRFGRGSSDQLQLQRSGWLPLQISAQCPAWRTLTWMLQASPLHQGHSIPAMLSPAQLGPLEITSAILLHQSRPKQDQGGHNSLVYWCSGSDGQPAVLKLLEPVQSPQCKLREEELLSRITAAGVPHVVRLVAAGNLCIDSMDYRALVLRPVGEPVPARAHASLVAQIVSDVARLTKTLAVDHGIWHRDYSPGNVLVLDGRALLIDFSVGKEAGAGQASSPTGKAAALTGTPHFCAISVLEGNPHTLHTAMEPLYYTALHWLSGGHVPGPLAFPKNLPRSAALRRGQMLVQSPLWLYHIPESSQQFALKLHKIFYHSLRTSEDVTTVTAEEVQSVCSDFI